MLDREASTNGAASSAQDCAPIGHRPYCFMTASIHCKFDLQSPTFMPDNCRQKCTFQVHPAKAAVSAQGVYKQMVEAFRSLGVEAVPGPGQPI